MDRGLVNQFLEVSEAAAFAAGEWTGKGERKLADKAATEAMRTAFNDIAFSGRVVIGEGERDEAPMLFIGEELGTGGAEIDIAVDPLEGTNLCATAASNALAVLALAPRGSLLHAPDTYMWKVAAGPEAKDAISIDKTATQNVIDVAAALGKKVEDLVVCMLDRDRNQEIIDEIRTVGARIRLISDGDIFGAIASTIEGSGIDMYIGSGAAPEGVLAATAIKCVDGGFEGRFHFRSEEDRARAMKMTELDVDGVLRRDDLVRGDDAVFIASGVTDGELLKGVRDGRVHSVIMDCKSQSIRFVETIYRHKGDESWTIN